MRISVLIDYQAEFAPTLTLESTTEIHGIRDFRVLAEDGSPKVPPAHIPCPLQLLLSTCPGDKTRQRPTAFITCMADSLSSPHQRQHQQQRPQPPLSNRQRGRRFRIACARCHHRKIRCDATTPSCGACIRSGVDCVYQGVLPGARERRSRSRAS